MEITGSRALRIWGLVHQYRLPDSAKDQRSANKLRRDYVCGKLARERDGLIAAYSKLDKATGKLTEASQQRVKKLEAEYKKRIKAEHKAGFAVVHEALQTMEPYPRHPGSMQPNFNTECWMAAIFLSVEDYLSTRPMQRALAWRLYVEQKGLRGFTYSISHEGKEVAVCRSRMGAQRVSQKMKDRLTLFFED